MTSTAPARSPPEGTEGGASSSTKITAPTFHGFPKLPPELRVKIWKAACLPRTDNDHGIQYITVDVVVKDGVDEDVVILNENLDGYDANARVDRDANGYVVLRALAHTKNRSVNTPTTSNDYKESAYLWDAGLWIACRESRNAIAKHLDIDARLQVGDSEIKKCPVSWYKKKFLSTLVPHKKDKVWRPMVVPRSDIFCIAAGPLRALPKNPHGMKPLAPFLGQRNFTITEDWKIAFKFDSGWNKGFPRTLRKLQRENSPRGLLAN
ncbi:hypothetical protein FVEN_g2162 [Fusarium venenatum]|uniref:2EXR domain-containing protein n=1 Tax=Fusarium venenatum TaxID=56646 RepID=A0A2L2SPQ4_9HYPO|nr:uncharacterized protein FVRRES_12575 [Fusarium venenatum]KAG8360060.1 hypothetical protein FVEN_g2162 [Fusarium venenatum]CEI39884.1 unnamed protein product [Fusarium venenatum]